MSSLRLEYVRAIQKSALDTTFGVLSKAFAGIEKLIELNVRTVKSSLGESQERLTGFFSFQQPHALFIQQGSLGLSALEKEHAYWPLACKVLSETQAELTILAEVQFRQFQHEAQTFVESIRRDVPAANEAAGAAWTFPKAPVEPPQAVGQA